ncbi:PP_RS20740 family protein [Methylobacterium sp. Leaf99]|uniref:PP_RS20740 family protein n=1 Tax=Methylobacterium sp. Leaf99 TaxID=1736251 RepID=UPI000AD58E4F|nr:hypothetical protein [Methylobacterium sp. Leaf99]
MAPSDDEFFGNEFAEESLPNEVTLDAVPIKLTELFAWHRPRKQKVRQDQWVGLATGLIDRLKAQNNLVHRDIVMPDGTTARVYPEVRYLTLPGLDYLDVRLIAEMCSGKDCHLTSVGFLSDAVEAPLMARAIVRETGLVQAGYISDKSVTFPRSFESICKSDGSTLAELRRRAPFHVVNIDACGSIAPTRAKHSGRLIDAIYRLVELQLSKANHRWLFFLTVDVRSGDMDMETLDAICNAIRENAAHSNEFSNGACDLLDPETDNIDNAIATAKNKDGRSLLDLFSLGISKWLLHLAEQKQWSVKLKRSHCYSTRPMDNPDPSMCSLAFEFIPPPVGLTDPFGVTRQQPSPGASPENPSMQILSAACQIDNLDSLMEQDAVLAETLNARTHDLLAEIGYEREALAPLQAQSIQGQTTPPYRYPDLVPPA